MPRASEREVTPPASLPCLRTHLASSSSMSCCTFFLSRGMPTTMEMRQVPEATTAEIQAFLESGVSFQL